MKIKDIHYTNVYKTKFYPVYNHSSGLIFIREFYIDDLELIRYELKQNYNVVDLELAPFIRTRSPDKKVFIITFNEDSPPYSIYIPGDRMDTSPFYLRSKPQPQQTRKCTNIGHPEDECDSEEIK